MFNIATLVLGTALMTPMAPYPSGGGSTAHLAVTQSPPSPMAPQVARSSDASERALRDPFRRDEARARTASGRKILARRSDALVDPFAEDARPRSDHYQPTEGSKVPMPFGGKPVAKLPLPSSPPQDPFAG